jgi:pimeloyl-ACP methyl ester carboxylesterase
MPAFHDAPEYGIFLGLREVLRQHHAMDQTADELALLVGSWPIHPMLFEGRSLLEVAGPDVVRARAEGLHRLDVGVPDAMLDGSQFDGFDPDAALAKIACPVHVLAGAVHLGGTITARDVERLASTIRHCTHRSLSGVGHLIHHTAVDVYVGEVRAFAEACR